jgi:hypothetical protein
MTPYTDKMFEIMNTNYKEKMGKDITVADLGTSTEHLNFFLTKSISQTLTLSQTSSINGPSKKHLL